MKLFDVVVDYVTTATITVRADDAFAAEAAVEAYMHTEEGQADMLRRMNVHRNVPDGFEIADVCEAQPHETFLVTRK